MSAPLIRATDVRDHAHAAPSGRVALDYEGRFLRRKVLTLADGGSILVDLAKTTSLGHGSVLVLEDGREIAVEAKAIEAAQAAATDRRSRGRCSPPAPCGTCGRRRR